MSGHRDAAMLQERIDGASFDEIGARYGLSHEGARQAVVRETERHIDGVERDLFDAMRADPDEAQWPTLLVPFQRLDGWQAALTYFQWVANELRERGWRLSVETAHTPAGTAFMLIGHEKEQQG